MLITKLKTEKYVVIQCNMKVVYITTNLKVNMYYVTCECHMDGYTKVIYYMILGKYLLTALVLNLLKSSISSR